jgi:hypothetical protein
MPKKAAMKTTPDWRRLGRFMLPLMLLLVWAAPGQAYVLMGEHVLDLMVKALGQADTLEVAQTVTIRADETGATAAAPLPETVRIRFPHDFRADAFGDAYRRQTVFSGTMALLAVNGELQGTPPRYARYHDLLTLKTRQGVVDFLRMAGVDVTVSSLGRLDDTYCYVIGARFPDEAPAQLWVDKNTFYPLRLLLPPRTGQTAAGPLEIRYRNWNLADGLAYPMHITLFENHQMMQEIRVDRLKPNPVFADDVFDIMTLRREWSRPAAAGSASPANPPAEDAAQPLEVEKKN